MSNYLDIIYKNRRKSNYPELLVKYIIRNYFKRTYITIPFIKLLDIGCGDRTFTKEFGFYKLEVYGIDKEINTTYRCQHFKRCDLEKERIPFSKDTFDYIFSKSTIEHIYNTDNFLSEAYRVLKPDGKIIIMTPDWESQHKGFYHDYTHVRPFTRKGLEDGMLIHNFRDVKVEKFYQLPLLWKYPWLKIFVKIVALLPDRLKWKDKDENIHRVWIRFSKELMLLGVGIK